MILEDHPVIALAVEAALTETGFSVIAIQEAAQALSRIEADPIDCAVLDVSAIMREGVDVLQRLKERQIPFVLSTALDPVTVPVALRDEPIIFKPYSTEELIAAVSARLSTGLERGPVSLGAPSNNTQRPIR